MQQVVNHFILTIKYIKLGTYSIRVTEAHVQKHEALYLEFQQLNIPPKLRKIESTLQALYPTRRFLFTAKECHLDLP